MLKFFKSIDYPLCFSTKGTWWLDDERYVGLFRGQKNWNIKVSIITLNEQKARAIERGVDSPLERIEAIRKIAKLDAGGATLRLRPFLIGITDPTHIELIQRAGEAGASAVSTEFFCMEGRSLTLKSRMPIFNEQSHLDYMAFYKKYSQCKSGYMRLNRNVKRQFINEMEGACKKAGMRFYVSDAHFKERSANGCCCGLPESWNYSRGQFCEALMIAKKKGSVAWGDIAQKMDHLRGFLWRKASGYNNCSCEKRAQFNNFTMFDYMRWLWNNPSAGQSPYRLFEGYLRPQSVDADKNLIYAIDQIRA